MKHATLGRPLPGFHHLEMVAHAWFDAAKAKWKTSYSARFWARVEEDILARIGNEPHHDDRTTEGLGAVA